MPDYTFPYFAIGIAKLLEGNRYSSELRYALGQLTLKDWFPQIVTASGLLALCRQPIETWWRGEAADSVDVLLVGDRLSESAENYLNTLRKESRYTDSISGIAQLADNDLFRQLLLRLRQEDNRARAQSEYVQLRRFLIEHAFATKSDIRNAFANTLLITPSDVRDLYMRADDMSLRDPQANVYYNCQRCGAVPIEEGIPQPLKPQVCGAHCPRWREGWEEIAPSKHLLVLRRGVQERTLIPGVPELRLLAALRDLHAAHGTIGEPVLWPGIDSYDIAMQVGDALWVVDVKDRGGNFGRFLKDIPHHPDIHWHRAFYVYPHEREVEKVQVQLDWTEILSDQAFLALVAQEA